MHLVELIIIYQTLNLKIYDSRIKKQIQVIR